MGANSAPSSIRRFRAAVAAACLAAWATGAAAAPKGAAVKTDLPRTEPEAQGVSSRLLLDFVKAVDEGVDSVHGFVLVRHGAVVAEGWWAPYDAATPHQLWSLTKSFTSIAVGLAIAEGRFGLDDEVLKYFGSDAPADPSANLKAMKIRHLLTMNTGHESEPPVGDWGSDWRRGFLAHPVPFAPGSHFLYNTPASGMLAALVERTTGTRLSDYLKSRLFDPLGIDGGYWWKAGDGTTFGGFGLHLTTGEISKFGQLLLQRGRWQGRQIVPADWIAAATSKQTENGTDPANDWNQGYGYQFWMCRHGFYRGDGAFGQFCIVMPDRDAVLAVTSGTGDMGKVMQLAWDKLLPALEPGKLLRDAAGAAKLRKTLAGLSMRPVKAAAASPAGIAGRPFVLEGNQRGIARLALQPAARGAMEIMYLRDGREWVIPCGNGKWTRGSAPWGDFWEEPVAASGGWTSPDAFTARICHLDSSFVHTVRFVFAGDRLTVEDEMNVAFGPAKLPEMRGAAAPGSERWVAQGGNDRGPGTREKPWRTLAKAAAAAEPGDVVRIASGTWRERLIPTRSGTAAAPIVFAAAPGATPVIDGKGIRLDGGMTGLVHVERLSWIEIRGLTVRNAGPGETAAGIMGRHCANLTIRGCRTAGTSSSGIGVWFSTSVFVDGNDVTDACRGGSQECITVAGCDGFEIRGNVVHDCANGDRGGEGIDAKHGANGVIHRNVVHHIRRVGIYVDAWDINMHDVEVKENLVHDTKANGYALAAENNGTLSRVSFHDNVAFRNAHAGLTLADWGEKVPHHGLEDITIDHNTFIGNGTGGWGGGLRLDNAEATGIAIRDNLFADNKPGQIYVDKKPKSMTIDHNFVTGEGGDENETAGDRAVRGVPHYREAPNGGVELDPGSPGEGFGAR